MAHRDYGRKFTVYCNHCGSSLEVVRKRTIKGHIENGNQMEEHQIVVNPCVVCCHIEEN